MLGFFFGAVPSVVRHKLRNPAAWWADGLTSAKSWAVMTSLFTAVSCIAQRIREKDDVWNRGAAGCATGLVIGWHGPNAPLNALQTGVALGGLSCLVDMIPGSSGGASGTPPAHAATLVAPSPAGSSSEFAPGCSDGACVNPSDNYCSTARPAKSSCRSCRSCHVPLLPAASAAPHQAAAVAAALHLLQNAAAGRASAHRRANAAAAGRSLQLRGASSTGADSHLPPMVAVARIFNPAGGYFR